MMPAVIEKIEKKVEKQFVGKTVFTEETLKVLAENLNGWGEAKQEPYLKEGFSYVSPRLLKEYGYFNKDGSLRICYFVDLFNQAHEIVENMDKHLGYIEPFFLDEIDLPDKKRGVILLILNCDGKMSIKLPTER